MDFLTLVNRLKVKSGVTGPKIVSLINQVEEVNKLIYSINEAWVDIQLTREDWLWMRASASCTTNAGQFSYAPTTDFGLTDFANWAQYTFRNYNTAAGINSEIRTDSIDYDEWRNTYQMGATRDARTRPIEVTITPQLAVGCGPTPSSGYTITGDYYKVAAELVDKADVPALPPQYHMAIVYRAMMFYGMGEAATEVYQEGQIEFKRSMALIALNQLKAFTMGGALA